MTQSIVIGLLSSVRALQESMVEPWNRVNIPIPSVVSCVGIPFDSSTDGRVKSLLMANDTVLNLLGSKVLQTEVRLLYGLLYALNNNYRMNKTFRALKQVEQSINRLKEMKLDAALQDLKQLCPKKHKRALGCISGVSDVPSQPMLEWFCLKVLGAAQLMDCAMTHCIRACVLAKQLLKQEEFVMLNVVFIGMLSRLWVFFRGIMANLGPLYKHIVALRKEVSEAQPMPYLASYSLPEDTGMDRFLGLHGASVAAAAPPKGSLNSSKKKRQRAGSKGKKGQENLGIAIQRDQYLKDRLSASLEASVENSVEGPVTRSSPKRRTPRNASKLSRQCSFHKRVRAAATFAAMATHLKDMIPRCRSLRRQHDKRRLTLLYLKCQKMRCLESAGYILPRRLRSFQQEVLSSPGKVSGARLSPAALWRRSQPRRSFKRSRAHCGSLTARSCGGRRRKRSRVESSPLTAMEDSTGPPTGTAPLRSIACNSPDEIDNIFSCFNL